jgi:hypothetical protein
VAVGAVVSAPVFMAAVSEAAVSMAAAVTVEQSIFPE